MGHWNSGGVKSDIYTSIENPYGDAFGRFRVSNPTSIFYSSLTYGLTNQDLVWDTSTTGTGAVAAASSGANLTTAADADDAVLQSLQYHRYQPGKSQLIKVTGAFGAADSGVTKRCGYFDGDNGIFFQQDGDGTLKIVKRNNGSDTAVAQASWNIDTFPDFDFDKAFILIIDIEWLGVGSVRVGFVDDGKIKYAHVFHHAGSVSVPYMETATLPIRYQISQSGAGSGSFQAICSAVDSEGGLSEELGIAIASGNGVTQRSASGSGLPVYCIRPATTLNSVTNRVTVFLQSIDVYVETKPAMIQVVAHSTVSGGAWAAVDSTYSSVEENVTATSISGGLVVAQFVVATSSAGNKQKGGSTAGIGSRIPMSLDIAGTGQGKGWAVMAYGIGGNASVTAQLNWVELY